MLMVSSIDGCILSDIHGNCTACLAPRTQTIRDGNEEILAPYFHGRWILYER